VGTPRGWGGEYAKMDYKDVWYLADEEIGGLGRAEPVWMSIQLRSW
jgi:hypothetical protein